MRVRSALLLLTVALAVLGVQADQDGEAGAQGGECVSKLSQASAECSAALNRANKVAYRRLDRLFGSRGNGAFHLDSSRFFHLAVGFSQDEIKVPDACCKVAAEVLSQDYQDDCACRSEVVQYTKWFDKELMDYYSDFLTSSCGLSRSDRKQSGWKTCGLDTQGFIYKAQEAAFTIPDWVDQLASIGKNAARTAAGAARNVAGAAEGAARRAAGAATGLLPSGGDNGVLSNLPFGRRLQEGNGANQGQCSANEGQATRVAQNDASSVSFYFLCPPGKGHCSGGKCVFGRTAAVAHGAWATCAPLDACAGASGCFPAGATVRLPGGATKRMDQIRVGDKVLAATPDGTLEFQDVYFFGHRDAGATAPFVRLELAGGRALELTPDHFVPVVVASDAGGALEGARMTYARDVAVGDVLLVAAEDGGDGKGLARAAVVAASPVRRAGLYNPYTMGGTVVVDGVLASSHSSWLIDGAAARLGLSHAVPAALQAAFAPLRAMYRALGPARAEAVGDALAAAGLRLEAALLGSGSSGGSSSAAAAVVAPAVATVAAAAAASALLLGGKRRRPAARA